MKKFWNFCKKVWERVWNTKIHVGSVIRFSIRFSVIAFIMVLLTGSFATVTAELGLLFGVAVCILWLCISGVFYIKFLKGKKTTIELIEGIIAFTIYLVTCTVAFFAAFYVCLIVADYTNPQVGWTSFVLLIVFTLLFVNQVRTDYCEDEEV